MNSNTTLLKNYLHLVFVQGSNFLVPIISLPYLVKVLGMEKFGLISFSVSLVAFFTLITGFGFHLSGTRSISVNRENKGKINSIFSNVITLQSILLFISTLLFFIVIKSFEKFSEHQELYVLTFLTVPASIMLPIWFFQGLEKMKYISYINTVSRILYLVLILVLVKDSDDYLLVPIINGVTQILSGILALYIIKKQFNVSYKKPEFSDLIYTLKDSSGFFLARISVIFYTVGNTFILGLVSSPLVVGYYAVAEKIYKLLQQIYQPVTSVLYPFMANKKDVRKFKAIFYLSTLINVLMLLLVLFLSNELISLIADEGVIESAEILKILLISSLFVVPSILIGYPFLAALGFKKEANSSVVYGALVHVSLLLLLYINSAISAVSIASALIFTELIVLTIRIKAVHKNRLWSTT